jgi:hypothetical protein
MRLPKCQRRNQCAAGERDNYFLHYDASVLNVDGFIVAPMGVAYRVPR